METCTTCNYNCILFYEKDEEKWFCPDCKKNLYYRCLFCYGLTDERFFCFVCQSSICRKCNYDAFIGSTHSPGSHLE